MAVWSLVPNNRRRRTIR